MAKELKTFTAFAGTRRIGTGDLHSVAKATKTVLDRGEVAPVVILDDETCRVVEVDFRGMVEDVLERLGDSGAPVDRPEPRGPGRPKLGVVAREVTLLPRHWEWLNAQPGGASVALRKLVDEARRASGDRDRLRAARDAAYHFMSTMAGNLANFEEASRALFADDRRRFAGLIADWPTDVRDHIVKLAYSDRAD
jgi:uncharacterized protein